MIKQTKLGTNPTKAKTFFKKMTYTSFFLENSGKLSTFVIERGKGPDQSYLFENE